MDEKLAKKLIESRKKAKAAFDTYHHTEETKEQNLKKQYKPITNELVPIKSSIDDQVKYQQELKRSVDKQIEYYQEQLNELNQIKHNFMLKAKPESQLSIDEIQPGTIRDRVLGEKKLGDVYL